MADDLLTGYLALASECQDRRRLICHFCANFGSYSATHLWVRGQISDAFCVAIGAALLSFMTAGITVSKAAEIDTSAEFAFVTDFGSGKVLMAKEPDTLMKPASMARS